MGDGVASKHWTFTKTAIAERIWKRNGVVSKYFDIVDGFLIARRNDASAAA
jgi:hypothetical protein